MTLFALGHFILRVGIGLLFIGHGYPLIIGGSKEWLWLGSQMQYLGIRFVPWVWGLLAAGTEFFGGIALVLGFYTRIAAFFIACAMSVALTMHLHKGDSYSVFSHALANLLIMISLMLMGGGMWSLRGG